MSGMHSPLDDVLDFIDRDCSQLSPPGLDRESRDEQCGSSTDRDLSKTAVNALYKEVALPQSPQRVSGKSSHATMVPDRGINQLPAFISKLVLNVLFVQCGSC